ncbi:MAG: phenylacetate--CoA ligase family protein [Pseudomonadota bacterium]
MLDDLETRDPERRAADLAAILPEQIARAKAMPGYGQALAEIDPARIVGVKDLATLPVFRKSDLAELQAANAPFGGLSDHISNFSHVFQSPGPVYEPGQIEGDWWRMGRFLRAVGIGRGDILQNCFSYHMTPAGQMVEAAARAVGATVFPAGTGQTELQVQAAHHLGVTAYVGTPDYLKTLLDAAEAAGLRLRITKAAVSGGALFPSLRAGYEAAGIACLQAYATADLGNVAYETVPDQGLIVDEGIVVEVVRPGTGDPVPVGEVGEVVVTTLTPEYPLIRFATGDLSAVLPGVSTCGRTNMRLKGWMGRADQTTKVRGMFVRPEQVAALVARFDGLVRARVVVSRKDEKDEMLVEAEAAGIAASAIESVLPDVLKVRGKVSVVDPGTLPNDGRVIVDERSYD